MSSSLLYPVRLHGSSHSPETQQHLFGVLRAAIDEGRFTGVLSAETGQEAVVAYAADPDRIIFHFPGQDEQGPRPLIFSSSSGLLTVQAYGEGENVVVYSDK